MGKSFENLYNIWHGILLAMLKHACASTKCYVHNQFNIRKIAFCSY